MFYDMISVQADNTGWMSAWKRDFLNIPHHALPSMPTSEK